MSKFKELAEGIKGDLKDWDNQADALMKERLELKKLGDEVFSLHRDKHKEVRSGLTAMKEAVMDLTGGNRPPPETEQKEGSGEQSDSFRTIDGGKAA